MDKTALELTYDGVEDFHFETLGREVEHVVKVLLRQLHRTEAEIPQVTELEVFQLFMEPFLRQILKTSNTHLLRDDVLTMDDLQKVVIVKAGESYYGRPASVILDDAARRSGDFNPAFRVLGPGAYADIIRRIRVIAGQPDKTMSWDNPSDSVDELAELESLFVSLFRAFHAHGVAVLSLDDDKLRKLSQLFSRLGLKRTFTRDSGACPVMHMVASVLTGLIFGGRLDRQGQPLSDTVFD